MHPIEPVGPSASSGAPFLPPAPSAPSIPPPPAPFGAPVSGAAPFGSAAPSGGAPACASCGSAPVRRFTFVEGRGMIMVRQQKRTSAVLCRSCALSVGRRIQALTFVFGWWGFISMFVNWVTLWTNAKALSQAAEMAPPQPTAWSTGKAPLDPGQPVTRRWQIVVPIGVAAFWLFFLVHIVTG